MRPFVTAPGARVALTPALVDRFASYHRRELSWGIFHVALDDDNYEADCDEPRTDEERDLASLFRQMSRTQRAKLAALR